MAAIITETFRKTNALRLYEALQGLTPSETYYVGLGKNDPWPDDGNVSTFTKPVGGSYQSKDVLLNLIAMKKVDPDDVAFVLPRVNWTAGVTFKAWDPADTNCWYASGTLLACYAVYNGSLYLCVKSPLTVTTTAPSEVASLGVIAQAGTSGYYWVRLQDSTSIATNRLYTNKWYPVVEITGTPISAEDGKVLRVDIVSGGSGYATNQTNSLNVYGDGGALTVTVGTGTTGTAITSAVLGSTNNTGFTYGNVLESDIASPLRGTGSGASFRVVVAPAGGFGGSNNFAILPLWFLGFPALFTETGGGDWPISFGSDTTDYRQISLIRNPEFNVGATTDTVLTLLSASYSGTVPISGGYIKKADGTKAYVDYVNAGTSKFYYHTSLSSTGFNSETVTTGNYTVYNAAGVAQSGTCAVSGITEPEYERYTGEVMFVENRAPIVRSDGQSEDIKIIIQF